MKNKPEIQWISPSIQETEPSQRKIGDQARIVKMRIRKRYRELGMTQEDFAIEMGYSGNSGVSKVLSDGGSMSLEFLLRAAEILEVNAGYFFMDKDRRQL